MYEIVDNNLIEICDTLIDKWHRIDNIIFENKEPFMNQVIEILASNYRLWHLEDLARDPEADDKIIADVKRKIDKENQKRNDNIEKFDILLDKYLKANGIKPVTEEINSETPGSIIDRITILSLKIYHMQEQAARKDATEEHKKNCVQKVIILKQQRDDLKICLFKLLDDIINGRKKHKIYYQFKMYNDPSLNPVFYKKNKS